jgi:hypothetical protein
MRRGEDVLIFKCRSGACYLGSTFSKDVILIQITLSAGRTVEQKKAFDKRIGPSAKALRTT